MQITEKPFGITREGEKATLYTIANDNGMEVVVTNYGANITSIIVPGKDGKKADVVLGYDTLADYEVNPCFFGSFIGRHANRIADAKFTLNGTTYQIEVNDGVNNLHSASKSYNKFLYEVEVYKEEDEISIEFSRLSPDMEQGFPGNLDYSVTYTLTNDNELVIEYYAVSDKDTIANFTNHSYFNLAGHNSGPILDQEVFIDSDKITTVREGLIPTGEYTDVTGTPMDFRTMKKLGKDIKADYAPLKMAGGYDHNYVLNTSGDEIEKVAELYDAKSGRLMEVFTDLPGMQLYTGNFITEGTIGKGKAVYNKNSGVCFETQYYPNSCNIPSFPSPVIKAREEVETVTIYKFSCR
ncbi:MAG: galactose mutarotase [Clostridiales bacterium]|nr:galactose mutarotase [Clostridiales bacterium]